MILIKEVSDNNILEVKELRGLSTDLENFDLTNFPCSGKFKFYEIDTGKTYYLNRENNTWEEA